MSDAIRSPEPDDDPFLEFPSERDMVSGLARRLRQDESGDDQGAASKRAPAETAKSIPDSLWQTDADSLISMPDAPRPRPVLRPVSRSELLLAPKRRAFPGPDAEDDAPASAASRPIDDGARGHVDDLTDQIRARASAQSARTPSRREIVMASGAVALMLVLMLGYVQLTSGETATLPVTMTDEVPTSNATITSRPDKATVVIDGVERGVTPLTLALEVGDYQLELRHAGEVTPLPLTVEPDTSVSAHVELAERTPPPPPPAGAPAPARAPAHGWVAIDVPMALTVSLNGREIGSTAEGRLQLPAGHHQLELASPALEFRAVVDVTVTGGRTTTAAPMLPNGTVSISAWPWAFVTVNGQAVGATPLGNLQLPIGNHEVVWTHPQFGERRRTVTVTARTPVQVGVDFTQ